MFSKYFEKRDIRNSEQELNRTGFVKVNNCTVVSDEAGGIWRYNVTFPNGETIKGYRSSWEAVYATRGFNK